MGSMWVSLTVSTGFGLDGFLAELLNLRDVERKAPRVGSELVTD